MDKCTITKFNLDDCDVQYFRTGFEVYKVNKTPRACRVIHRPTGLMEQRTDGLQNQNKYMALLELERRVNEHYDRASRD